MRSERFRARSPKGEYVCGASQVGRLIDPLAVDAADAGVAGIDDVSEAVAIAASGRENKLAVCQTRRR